MSLLVVAGEASGDRAAAGVLRELPGVDAFGLGGPACRANGLRALATPPLGVAGFLPVLAKAVDLVRAHAAVLEAARAERPDAALLVDYTEFNHRLAPRLRALGTKVLWYVAPQVWAWRPSRLVSLPPRIDAMAVLLPFEEALWRAAGVDARYVGHPAVRPAPTAHARTETRRQLGLVGDRAVALLPGSRPAEVNALLPAMLDAIARARRDLLGIEARLVLAPGLPPAVTRAAMRRAADADVPVVTAPAEGAGELLDAFAASLVASGTASLEAALAGAHPVVTYRTDRLTAAVVGALLRTPWIGLPNVLLRRPVWPELVQNAANGAQMANELRKVLERRARFDDAARELRECLGEERKPGSLVAAHLRRWLRSAPPPPRPHRPRPAPSSTISSSR